MITCPDRDVMDGDLIPIDAEFANYGLSAHLDLVRQEKLGGKQNSNYLF